MDANKFIRYGFLFSSMSNSYDSRRNDSLAFKLGEIQEFREVRRADSVYREQVFNLRPQLRGPNEASTVSRDKNKKGYLTYTG